MSQALYYPWIDVPNEAWLKTALLYWDSVRTIVPESIDDPYSTDTGRALRELEFLVPLRVHSGMQEIEELSGDVLSYLHSAEGAELLISGHSGRMQDIHVEKLPYELRRLVNLHPEKLPNECLHLLSHAERDGDWLSVDRRFATFYMTLLASRLADRVGARLVTPLAAADRLAVQARFDAQMNSLVPWVMDPSDRHWCEYEAFGLRRTMPTDLAPGMLANLALERIAVAPDTSIERLIEFRAEHQEELGQFRTKVEQLASSISEDLSVEALQQRVSDVYTGEVAPAVKSLKDALKGHGIEYLSEGLLKVSFMSAPATCTLVYAGLDVPWALLAGATVSLIVTGAMYNAARRASLNANPFAYLLSVEHELA